MAKKRTSAYIPMPIETSTASTVFNSNNSNGIISTSEGIMLKSSGSHNGNDEYRDAASWQPLKSTTNTASVAPQKRDKTYLFKCLLLANFLQYLEAGAVPALLLQLSESFNMQSGQQGLLGGVVYLSLSLGGPFAGYLLRHYEHKAVICTAVAVNMFFTLIWALTPVGEVYSTHMFIAVRFVMGLCQCIVCVFLPLWTNENAPKESRTKWMSYLQASVPFGIMMGYIIASVITTVFHHATVCLDLLCWRWPFLIEIMLLTPLYFGLYFIPKEDIAVTISREPRSSGSSSSRKDRNNSYNSNGSSNSSSGRQRSLSTSTTAKNGAEYDTYRVIGDCRDDDDATAATVNATVVAATATAADGRLLLLNGRHISGSNADEKSTLIGGAEIGAEYYDALKDSSDEYLQQQQQQEQQQQQQQQQQQRPQQRQQQQRRSMSSEEQQRRHSLRQQSMSASMCGDPMSTINVIKNSCDDMTLLENNEDMFHSITGFHWSGREDSPYSELNSGFASRSSITSATAAAVDVGTGSNSSGGLFQQQSLAAEALSRYNSSTAGIAAVNSIAAGNSRSSNGSCNQQQVQEGKSNSWFWGGLSLQHWNSSTAGEYSNLNSNGNSISSCGNDNDTIVGVENPLTAAEAATTAAAGRTAPPPSTTSAAATPSSNTQQQRLLLHSRQQPSNIAYESFRDLSNRRDSGSSWGGFFGSWSNANRLSKNNELSRPMSVNSSSSSTRTNSVAAAHRHRFSDDMQLHEAATAATAGAGGDSDSPSSTERSRSRSTSAIPFNSQYGGRQTPSDQQPKQLQLMPSIHSCDSCDNRQLAGDGVPSADAYDPEAAILRGSSGPYSRYQQQQQQQFDHRRNDSFGSESESDEDEWESLTSRSRASSTELENAEMLGSSEQAALNALRNSSSDNNSSNKRFGNTTAATGSGSASSGRSAVACTKRVMASAYRQSRSVIQSVLALLAISTYRYLLGAMTALYFTVTGVQYWGTKYLSVALSAPLPLVNALFILCAATGPTLGVFFGGWIVDKCGGYKGPHQRVVALEICSTFGVLAAMFSIPVTFFSNIFVAVSLLWLVLFFGGSMLPACSGIIVSIIPREYRPTSSSLSLVVFNMFGYFMSLVLSGLLMQVLESYDDSICDAVCAMTWGFRLVLFWSFFSLFFLLNALMASYRHMRDRDRSRSSSRRRKRTRSSSSGYGGGSGSSGGGSSRNYELDNAAAQSLTAIAAATAASANAAGITGIATAASSATTADDERRELEMLATTAMNRRSVAVDAQ